VDEVIGTHKVAALTLDDIDWRHGGSRVAQS
jgi:hypothetical protein